MALNPQFQVSLDVHDRLCVVLGGGEEAEDKVLRLLRAGARVRLVATQLTAALQREVSDGRVLHAARAFTPQDLEGAFLVMNTVSGQPEQAQHVHAEATRRHLLINTYDSPALSTFGQVAVVEAGHLRLGISTSNASPSLAGRLRRELADLFDAEVAEYLDQLARVRLRVRQRVPSFPRRAALLRSLVRDVRVEGRVHLPARWREQTAAMLRCDLTACGTQKECAGCPGVAPDISP